MNLLKYALKSALFETPLSRFLGPRYAFNFEPAQLAFLCARLDETRMIDGSVVEAGCFAGGTTVFLNAHLSAAGIEKTYFAIDTFGGFVASQAKHEIESRGKTGAFDGFGLNSQRWFDRTMEANGVRRVRSVKADVASFDFSPLGPISFCLLDVDLYIPTKAALPRIFDVLAPGGIVVSSHAIPLDDSRAIPVAAG